MILFIERRPYQPIGAERPNSSRSTYCGGGRIGEKGRMLVVYLEKKTSFGQSDADQTMLRWITGRSGKRIVSAGGWWRSHQFHWSGIGITAIPQVSGWSRRRRHNQTDFLHRRIRRRFFHETRRLYRRHFNQIKSCPFLFFLVFCLTVFDEICASLRYKWCVSQRRKNFELKILPMTVPEWVTRHNWMSPSDNSFRKRRWRTGGGDDKQDDELSIKSTSLVQASEWRGWNDVSLVATLLERWTVVSLSVDWLAVWSLRSTAIDAMTGSLKP